MSANIIQQIAIIAPPFLLAITFHEFCHGYVAWSLGDPTAHNQGRLTMNPLKHIDPIGLLAIFIIRIGWAKPIPVNASYFKNPLRGMLWVAIAGPGANFLLAIVSAVLVKLLTITASLWPGFLLGPIYGMLTFSVRINLLLAFFNLLPIPPLDGSRIITSLASAKVAMFFHRIEPFSFIIILVLFWLGILGKVIFPITNLTYSLFVG